MKTQLTLAELAAKVQYNESLKTDFIAPVSRLRASLSDAGAINLEAPGAFSGYGLTTTGHAQMASHLGVPKAFYDRLKTEMPDLLVENVNRLAAVRPEPRLLRTLDGNMRAVLSDRYLAIDNFDVAHSVLGAVAKAGDLQVRSSAVTEEKMWIKAISFEKQTEITRGDFVAAGFAVSNSEVGMGMLKVEPFIERLICTNGMRVNEATSLGIKRRHVGSRLQADENWSVYTDETKRTAMRAFLMQISDVIAATVSDTTLEKIAGFMRAATGKPITGSVEGAIVEVRKILALTEDEGTGVFEHLIRGGDLSQYGVMNAVTRASQDVESYDRASEMEAMGWDVVTLSDTDWRRVSAQ